MEQQREGDAGADPPAKSAHPRDGSIDFSGYSLQQLTELEDTLNRQAFPRNYASLLAELERRRALGAAAPGAGVNGRFTLHDGWRGSWEALRRRLPLYGAGSVEVRGGEVILQGRRRTWLGVPQQSVLIIPAAKIRNVACEQSTVRFEWPRRGWRARIAELQADTPEEARQLASLLPATQTPGFGRRWAQLREYERRLAALQVRPWVTSVLVGANIAVYLALAVRNGRLGDFDLQQLIDWGADFGPLTLHGQPWRLISATFLHFDLLHVGLNMWVLWCVGRLAERLYGTWPYLLVYFCSSLMASTASVAWNLGSVNIGASGAIFGVLGAFLAFFARRRNELPVSLWRAHAPSTLLFVLVNIFSGAVQPLIDNAAHLGGLTAGVVVGWVLALPLSREERQEFPFRQTLAALMLTAAGCGALLLQVSGLMAPPNPTEQYFLAHDASSHAAEADLQLWQQLGAQQAQGTITARELARRFSQQILPFWQQASRRMDKELKTLPAAQLPVAKLMSRIAQLRVQLAGDVIALVGGDASRLSDIRRLSQRADLLTARIERLQVRATMDDQALSLSESPWALALRRWLPGQPSGCVEEPAAVAEGTVAPTDDRTDGPAREDALGCHVQQLFLSGDYLALNALILRGEARLNDLPDGSSSLTAVYRGLDKLFSYSRLTVPEALSYTAAWRRAVPGSAESDLVEALLFRDWAWRARGTGYAVDVTPQAWEVFAYRSEMAAASLEDAQSLARVNPQWYVLWLEVGLDQASNARQLRVVFDEGVARFPSYGPLYGAMLRILMPRWGGSFQQVDDLIRDVTHMPRGWVFTQPSQDTVPDLALYARLYWIYASLERDGIDLFSDAQARWDLMRQGFLELRRLYPRSDYILNAFAKMACMADDRATYAQLRSQLKGHLSASAWSRTLTLALCDAKLMRATKAGLSPH